MTMDINGRSKIVAASGFFDPVHSGHLEYLEKAKALGDYLIVILNRDDQAIDKKGFVFMSYKEREKIISSLRFVDKVVPCIDKDGSVCDTLRMLKPDIFAKGGDRHIDNIPEAKLCNEIGISMVFGLGEKIQSSSNLVKQCLKRKNINN